jgi:multidrug efflux pump subunit AcrB
VRLWSGKQYTIRSAFTPGVVPLAVTTGAGAEIRQLLGTAVFFGMLGVTRFGLLFTPIFYAVARQPSDMVFHSR